MNGPKRTPIVLRNIVADMKDFDWEIYLLNYPELMEKGIRTKEDACNHYKKIGFWEKRNCLISDKFDAERYLKAYGHLGLKTPRDAYIHFMRVGRVLRRGDGFKRTTQAYRMPVASRQRNVIEQNRQFNKQNNSVPLQSSPLPRHQLQAQTSPPQQQQPALRRHFQPLVVRQAIAARQQNRLPANSIVPTLLSMNTKRQVKQPKPGQLVIHEPPSSYFARMYKLGPPKYIKLN